MASLMGLYQHILDVSKFFGSETSKKKLLIILKMQYRILRDRNESTDGFGLSVSWK